MANAFAKEEIVLFEKTLEAFEADNVVAKRANMFSQQGQNMQRSNDQVWRPVPQISTVVNGLDITGLDQDVNQLVVPANLDTIANVPFTLDALQMRDENYMQDKAKSAAQTLSADINKAIATVVLQQGSLVQVQAGNTGTNLTGYDDISLVDALMVENEVTGGSKTMVLSARDNARMGSNLAQRTLMSRSEEALDTTRIGPIANFNTFSTSFAPTLTAAAGAATVTGVQRYVPASTVPTATGTNNVDNRSMALTISSSASMKAGDKFTLAGINAVSHISKNDTLQPKTFTITAINNATSIQISPPIIVGDGSSDVEDQYANCTAATTGGSSMVFLNTVGTAANIFFRDNSIEIFSGRLAFNADMAGVATMRMTTDSGLEVLFAKQGNMAKGTASYRLTTFYGVTNLNPEMNGVLLGAQTF